MTHKPCSNTRTTSTFQFWLHFQTRLFSILWKSHQFTMTALMLSSISLENLTAWPQLSCSTLRCMYAGGCESVMWRNLHNQFRCASWMCTKWLRVVLLSGGFHKQNTNERKERKERKKANVSPEHKKDGVSYCMIVPERINKLMVWNDSKLNSQTITGFTPTYICLLSAAEGRCVSVCVSVSLHVCVCH